MDENYFQISWGSLWKILTLVVLTWILFLSLPVLLAILVALVIAAGLDSPVSWFQKKGVPRLLSTLLLFIVGIIFIAGIVYTIIPLAIADFTQLFLNLKGYTGPIFGSLQASEALGIVNNRLTDLADTLISGTLPLTQVAAALFGNLFLAITVLMLSFYLTVGQEGVKQFLIAILPAVYEDTAIDFYLKTRKRIGQWLKGQLLLSLVVGLITYVGLSLLGVKYSLLLAILAGIFEIIPFVGPIFSGAIAVLVALSTSLSLSLYTLGLFVIIQQLENNLLVPLVMRYTTNLNPAVILISLLIGGKVFGFTGLILAVPASVMFQEILEKWAVTKKKKKGLAV